MNWHTNPNPNPHTALTEGSLSICLLSPPLPHGTHLATLLTSYIPCLGLLQIAHHPSNSETGHRKLSYTNIGPSPLSYRKQCASIPAPTEQAIHCVPFQYHVAAFKLIPKPHLPNLLRSELARQSTASTLVLAPNAAHPVKDFVKLYLIR
jgi:hypothetical protein